MNKKGIWSFTTIAKIALTLIILFFLILFVIKYLGSEAPTIKIINTQIGALGDYDNDEVRNRDDKCPCTDVGSEQQAGLRGCPKGTTAEQAKINQQKFNEQKCSEVTATATQIQVFSIEISATSQESYETTKRYLRYTFACPLNIQCSLQITDPGARIQPDTQPDVVNELVLVNGLYVFDLLDDESGQVLKTVTVTKK